MSWASSTSTFQRSQRCPLKCSSFFFFFLKGQKPIKNICTVQQIPSQHCQHHRFKTVQAGPFVCAFMLRSQDDKKQWSVFSSVFSVVMYSPQPFGCTYIAYGTTEGVVFLTGHLIKWIIFTVPWSGLLSCTHQIMNWLTSFCGLNSTQSQKSYTWAQFFLLYFLYLNLKFSKFKYNQICQIFKQ